MRNVRGDVETLLRDTGETFTADEIANEIGVCAQTARRHIRALLAENLIHVACWDRWGKKFLANYAWGKKKHAPQPPGLTPRQRYIRHRRRHYPDSTFRKKTLEGIK